MLQATSYQKQQNSVPVGHEPKSAHSTSVTEKYVEERKEKANKQVKQERKEGKVAIDKWARVQYTIL